MLKRQPEHCAAAHENPTQAALTPSVGANARSTDLASSRFPNQEHHTAQIVFPDNGRRHLNFRQAFKSLPILVNDIYEATGYSIDLDKVTIKVLPRAEAQRIGRENPWHSNNPTEPPPRKSLRERLVETIESFVLSHVTLQEYLWPDSTIYIREESALRADPRLIAEVLRHELIHVGQHQTFPAYFQELMHHHTRLMSYVGSREQHKVDQACMHATRITAMVSWLEAEAAVLQRHFSESDRLNCTPPFDLAYSLSTFFIKASNWGGELVADHMTGHEEFKTLQSLGRALVHTVFNFPALTEIMGDFEYAWDTPEIISEQDRQYIEQILSIKGLKLEEGKLSPL